MHDHTASDSADDHFYYISSSSTHDHVYSKSGHELRYYTVHDFDYLCPMLYASQL